MNSYPEHKKQDKVRDKSQSIGEFIEWLDSKKGICLCKYHTKEDDTGYIGYLDVHTPIIKLLAEFFEIDLEKIEAEKQQMLKVLRNPPQEPLVWKEG